MSSTVSLPVFAHALSFVLVREGGYANDPTDKGGETNLGISDLRDGLADGKTDVDGDGKPDVKIKDLTKEQAGLIYQRDYWQAAKCDLWPDGISLFVFDSAVQHGVKKAVQILQAAVGVSSDGVAGPKTINAVTGADAEWLLTRCFLHHWSAHMAHNVDDWLHALQQVMPRGRAWPRELNANLTKFLRAFAARLSRVEGDADSLLAEMRPETTTQLLTDWEEYLGLPECQPLSSTISARRRDAAEKHHRKGGLAPWQIEAVAGQLGFKIEVNVILPHHCLRSCTYPLWPARYRWLLQVVVIDIDGGRFTCIDNVLVPLVSGRQRNLECVLNQYRLAGSGYEYIY